MFVILAFALILHGALTVEHCKNGKEIISKVTKNPDDIIGNWTYVYHWDPKTKDTNEFIANADHASNCPVIKIEAASPDFVKAKEAECAKNKIPFNWADAKLKVDAPALKLQGGIITIGEQENWMVADCTTMVRLVLRKVCNDYILMSNPDMNNTSELIGKVVPSLDEMKCMARNLDVFNGVSGLGICYT